ncbi:MAG: hypothetical protein WDM91_00635 [Rhizomicrobium sp.]
MNMKLFGAVALACAAIVLTATSAFAGVTPISGLPVGVDHCPPDCLELVAHGATDAKGTVTFRGLKPGTYSIVIDSKVLIASLDKRQPSAKANGGDKGSDGSPGIIAVLIALLLPSMPTVHGTTPATKLSFEVPVCRDGAGGAIRVGFTIPEPASPGRLAGKPGDMGASISDQAVSLVLTSY